MFEMMFSNTRFMAFLSMHAIIEEFSNSMSQRQPFSSKAG